jgi:tetratricopeptide (TPR) repeat protein
MLPNRNRNTMHSKIRRAFWLAAVLWALPVAVSTAAAPGVPVTHGSVNRDYARITFEWPQLVYFTAKTQGRTLSITFDRPANPDFGPLLTRLSPYVLSAERKRDGKTLVLTLDKPYRIRTFVSDNITGVDLLGIDAKQKAPAATVAQTKKPVPGGIPAETLAALTPSAGGETEAAATPQAVPPSEETPKPETPKAETTKTEAPKTEIPKVEVPVTEPSPSAEAPTPVAAGSDSDTAPTQAASAAPADGRLKVSLSPSPDSAILRFPFTERTAMAVFTRGQALWIVFNKQVPLDLSEFENLPPTVISKVQTLPHHKATVLRMALSEGVHVNVAKEVNRFDWAVLLTPKKQPLASPLAIDINTEPPAPPHVFIAALEMTDPVVVRDPQIGDELVVTPLFNPGEGMAARRDFMEFTLLQTSQGVAVSKKADDVVVVQLRNGLRVSLPQGATLTPNLPEVSQGAANAAVSVVTLFPYDAWKPEDASPWQVRKQAQKLFQQIVDNDDPQESNEARLRLAQLYLSEGMASEALGLLDGINRTNSSYFRAAKLSALRGAANFMMHRFVEAARDFSSAELNNNREINYWRAMLADLLGGTDQTYDYLSMNDDYISKYPPFFRQKLAIVAADRSIDAKEYNTALKIFDKLQKDNLLDSINAYINFLLAKVSSDTGQEKEALEMWEKLAADYEHPFIQARAEFSRIAWGMSHGSLTKDQAIDRLERLRLGWHGDNLELQVLTLLGDLYYEQKDYVNAMRIWNGGVLSFPNTGASIEMSRKMQEVFITMFNEGIADKLPPLEALALYYEYRNYTPPGDVGNEMIERLADRLVGVDLLDQAAALLDHQMNFQTEKEQRSRIGVKLATIHLLNHQPQKSLVALQNSMYGENPLMLRLLRNRLTAQAMVELGQSDRALQTLGSDNSIDAERIRLNVYWREKDWSRLTASIEALLKARPDNTAPITLDESEYLLKLSLAYVFQNNTVQLQYMRDYFGPLMASNPNKPIFDFITGGDMPLTTTNFDEVLSYLADTRSFIDTYQASMRAPSTTAAAQSATAVQ